nr:arylesterase [uncultured Desulfobacter sp.]
MKKIIVVVVVTIACFLIFRSSDNDWKIKNKPLSVSRIVCFGDSLTFGTGASEGRDYPSVLEGLTGVEVINAGVPGNTTENALKRVDEDVLAYEPDVVLITLGGNDLKNRVGESTAKANLTTIIQRIQASGAMVILGGIEIPLYGKGFADMYQSVGEQTGSVLISNIFQGIFGNRKMMSDYIHPNDKGYEVMAGYFYEKLHPYLEL